MEFIQHNIWLVLLAVVSGGMLLFSMFGGRLRGINEVGVTEAVQLINHRDAIVVDVREDSEYNAGHIARSKHIALSHFATRVGDLDKLKDHPVVMICRSGNRSASACGILKKHGFNEVYNLKGGMMAWQQAGMPVEK